MIKKLANALFCATLVTATFSHGADVVGTWNMKMDFQGTEVLSTMTVTEADGALAGVWSGQRGDSDLDNVKIDGDTLTFSRTVNAQGQEFELTFSGKIDGSAIEGAFDSPMGALPVNGTLEGGASPAGGLDALVGTWDASVSSGLGDTENQMKFGSDGTGTFHADGDVTYDLTEVAVAGADVTFNMTIDMEGTELALTFEGKLDGTSLEGEFISELGNGTVSATKAGGGVSDVILAIVKSNMALLTTGDIDAMMVLYAEDFSSDQGGKAEMQEFLVGAKEQGFLDEMEILMDDITIEVDGDSASVEGIELEGAFGVLTLELELGQQDGNWLITSQTQY